MGNGSQEHRVCGSVNKSSIHYVTTGAMEIEDILREKKRNDANEGRINNYI